jgi:hypothetical protein
MSVHHHSQRQNVQAWTGNIPSTCDPNNSHWTNLLAKWWLRCFGTARLYGWWISWERTQQSMQWHNVQPWNSYEQPLNESVLDCSPHVFYLCTITLGPMSQLQHTTVAVLQVDNLGISAIQPISVTEWFSPLFHSVGSYLWPWISKWQQHENSCYKMVEIAGHRILQGRY